MTTFPRRAAARRGDSGLAGWQALALLGFALVTPTALPAGGADRRLPEVRRRQNAHEPLLSTGCLPLRCAPERRAPVITQVESGASLQVLQQWFCPQGRLWLRVEASNRGGRSTRGWLPS
jgi:hypothetical protein